MNILFVHEVDWLKKVVFDIHSLSEGLSLLGHQVFAIDYEDTWSRDNFFDLGRLKTKNFGSVARAFNGASVHLKHPGFIKIPGLSRISAACTHYIEIRKTLKKHNIEAVILYSVPTNGLQTIHLARKFNIPVIFRSIDILNQLTPYPFLRSSTRFLEEKVYSRVDMILSLTPRLSHYVINMGARANAVKLLPMPVDTDIFYPSLETGEIRYKWKLGRDDRIIVFIGTLFEFSGLDKFISQFPKVLKEIPQAKLLIVGDGSQRPSLEKLISRLGLEKSVIITGFQPYQTMPQYINLASVCLLPFLVTGATRDIFPGKIVQYLACAKAVVATPLSGLTAVIHGEDQGVVYARSATRMAEQAVSIMRNGERRQKLEQAGLNYIRKVHSCDKITHQLESILEEVIREKRHETISK